MKLKFLITTLIFSIAAQLHSQQNENITQIINSIYELEKEKDPKCYATANRLEDFMYGTPLTEDARNTKIEIQKQVLFAIKTKASVSARKAGSKAIQATHIKDAIAEISEFSKNNNGDYTYRLTTGNVTINKKDFDQYTSVAYGYRSLLSLEQDLYLITEDTTLPFSKEALEIANSYINLNTLVALKVSDLRARKKNISLISAKELRDTWALIFSESKNTHTLSTLYKDKATSIKKSKSDNEIVKAIIKQKIASYAVYNALSEKVFLRNLQVYFARQKWPVETAVSNDLRNYYLESLIEFSKTLIQLSAISAKKNNQALIRNPAVESALAQLLPIKTNKFEDVTFFPNHPESITLESYDLDAFRDSGFHWRILGYAIDDLSSKNSREIDPNAAELMVEGIAQMGVLVLRLAGESSKKNNKTILDANDIENGFITVQSYITNYALLPEKKVSTTLTSSSSTAIGVFNDVTSKANIDFEHKSADWLNRHIRSYTTSYDEGKIKLAIPPAFGGSGVAAEDINNDGNTDVLLLSGFGNKLFLNNGNGSFNDVTKNANISSWLENINSYGEPRQPIIVDFDNDGYQDIFISYVNSSHKIYKNNGDGTFIDVSKRAKLGGENAVGGPATALDYDNDGLLDIYIGYFGDYVRGKLPNLSRDNQNGSPNKLFKNIGNFVFKEIALSGSAGTNSGWTQAIGHSDIDQDGRQDIIVGNDFGVNKYYLNKPEGFIEMSKKLGTDKPSYTMNVGITDLNKDMYPDFYISNIVVMQKDEKYVSPNAETTMKFDPKKMANIRTVEANDLFLSITENNELSTYSLSQDIGPGYAATGWSWDADFFDFDNDGDEDLYCLNGMNDFSVYSTENPFYFERAEKSKTIVYAESNKERNVFFVNKNGKLINEAKVYGLDKNSNARSASYLDYDQDGDLDIIVNNYHEPAMFLQNDIVEKNNWIKIKLIGNPTERVNRDAIGSTIILNSENNENIWREIHSTSGYLSVHPKEQHFGLGTDNVVSILVKWNNGKESIIENLEANKKYTLTYPDVVTEN